jgi:hypothetical protein
MFFPYYELDKIYRQERIKEAEYYRLLQDLRVDKSTLQDSGRGRLYLCSIYYPFTEGTA